MPEWVTLVAVILGVQGLAWLLFLFWYRRRLSALKQSMVVELGSRGEQILRGPEPAVYRGGTTGYSRVKGNGTFVLTDRRILFQKLIGGRVEVPLDRIIGVRENLWFLRSATSGRQHLILQLNDGGEVGFIVPNHLTWMATIYEAIGTVRSTGA
jgi:hypothetical protein